MAWYMYTHIHNTHRKEIINYYYTMNFVEFLIPHLANVNVTDRAGRTSLHHAAFNGHVEVR